MSNKLQEIAPRLLYDRKHAAEQISVSVRSLDYLIAAKKLETRRVGKKVMIPYSSLVKFSRENHFEDMAAPIKVKKPVQAIDQPAAKAA